MLQAAHPGVSCSALVLSKIQVDQQHWKIPTESPTGNESFKPY